MRRAESASTEMGTAALLERDDVLGDLLALVDGARAGNGHIALVRGEAGIGKTAVATALVQSLGDDIGVLWGSCDDLLAPRPLGPLRDMAARDPGLAAALVAEDPQRMRDAVIGIFTGPQRPLVAVFEDVHWADGATLDLLALVGRRIAHAHTLLVMTFREKLPANHPLRAVLGTLPTASVASVRLQPISRQAVAELAAGLDATSVFDRTGGNPFLVTAALSNPDDQVPATVSDLMASLLAQLDDDATRLVQLVSVVPGQAELVLLHEIDQDLATSLSAAEDIGLLRIDARTVAFRHELARTAVDDALPEPLRRELHRHVLAAGARLEFDPARQAHHARLTHDVDAVLRWLPDAARQAAAERSHREAIIHLEALEPHLDLVSFEQRAELLELFASEEEYADGRGVQHAMAALELRRQLGEPSGLGKALLCAHRAVWTSGDFARAAELAREAVLVLEEVGGEDLALAYGQLARIATQNLDPDLADHYCKRALELAPEPSRARALALSTVGVQRNLADYPDGRELLEAAAAIAESLGLAWELQRARGNLIETAIAAKDVERARRDNELALASLDADIVTTLWHVHAGAKIDTAAGDYTAAETVLRDLLRTGRIDGTVRSFAEATLAKVLVRAGSSDAKRAVERLWDGARTAGQVQDRTTASTIAAEYLWVFRARDADLTARNLSAFEETVNSAARWFIGDQALWLWLDGHLDAIPARAAEPVRWVGDGQWRRAADWFGDRGVPFEQAVALSTGDIEARLEALRIAQRIGARALAARLRDDLRADGVTRLPRGPRRATRQSPLGLTPRQFEVLSLLAEGLPNAEIADRLFVSLRTVENHVSAILTKLGASNRDEAVAVAAEHGAL